MSKRGVSYNERSAGPAKRAIENSDGAVHFIEDGQEGPVPAQNVPAATRSDPILQRCGASSVMVGSKMYVCPGVKRDDADARV